MRAALSHSLSREVYVTYHEYRSQNPKNEGELTGQKASEPIVFVNRLTGAPNLSAQAQVLSKPFLLVVFVLSHDGSHDTALCILPFVWLISQLCCAKVPPFRLFEMGW